MAPNNQRLKVPFLPIEKANVGYNIAVADQFLNITEDQVDYAKPSALLENLYQAQNQFTIDDHGVRFYLTGEGNVYPVNPQGLNEEQYNMLMYSLTRGVDRAQQVEEALDYISAVKQEKQEIEASYLNQTSEVKQTLDASLKELDETIANQYNHINNLIQEGITNYFEYNAQTGSVIINNVAKNFISEEFQTMIANKLASYQNKQDVHLFEQAIDNFDKFQYLTNARLINEREVNYLSLNLNENLYLMINNPDVGLPQIKSYSDAQSLVNEVLEKTNVDLGADFLNELFTRSREQTKYINDKLNEQQEILGFLYDKKEDLNSKVASIGNPSLANNSVKEANALLDSEINLTKNNIRALEGVSRDDGFVKGYAKVDTKELEQGSVIMVDAMDYSKSSADDYVSVYKGDKLIKVEKSNIDIASSEL